MAAILQSHLAARGGRIFFAYFSINCLLHISINYMENVTDQWIPGAPLQFFKYLGTRLRGREKGREDLIERSGDMPTHVVD